MLGRISEKADLIIYGLNKIHGLLIQDEKQSSQKRTETILNTLSDVTHILLRHRHVVKPNKEGELKNTRSGARFIALLFKANNNYFRRIILEDLRRLSLWTLSIAKERQIESGYTHFPLHDCMNLLLTPHNDRHETINKSDDILNDGLPRHRRSGGTLLGLIRKWIMCRYLLKNYAFGDTLSFDPSQHTFFNGFNKRHHPARRTHTPMLREDPYGDSLISLKERYTIGFNY